HFNNKIWNALKLVKLWEARLNEPGQEGGEPSGVDTLLAMDVSGFSGTMTPSATGDQENIQSSESRDDFAVRWFTARLAEAKEDTTKMYGEFRLSEALKTIYSLIWDDFCSWYLEWVKPAAGQPINGDIFNSTIQFF